MREFMRGMKNFGRRVLMKMQEGRTVAVAGRWLALCLLIAGVAAVGVWGSAGEPGGVNGAIQAAWAPDVAPTDVGVNTNVLQNMSDVGKKNTAQMAENVADDTQNLANNAENDTNPNDVPPDDVVDDTDDVVDGAPEPWVGDAVLQAEADLLTLVPPLADWPGQTQRAFGYGYDETFGDYRYHSGADWQAAPGTAVLAALGGVVAEISEDEVLGRGVRLNCGEKLELAYFGLAPGELQVGQAVQAGDRLGVVSEPPLFEMGQTPHLHLEIWLDSAVQNPADYLPGQE